ncbi:hypothetical protein [Tychonema sp. LEGE 07203]|uniref:hypothetical protein n=1 Tax=Tychonema sp. LEGE 07203 TaxID=1828671 RepID=UPI0018830FC4|nr:hypothetical protein [Tychonema sp. LEGE 07203]MBE9095759.1 hypothetical protein [Tychonema sp. LEGE 07203]
MVARDIASPEKSRAQSEFPGCWPKGRFLGAGAGVAAGEPKSDNRPLQAQK